MQSNEVNAQTKRQVNLPVWWNGRHQGLKIPCRFPAYRFESGHRHKIFLKQQAEKFNSLPFFILCGFQYQFLLFRPILNFALDTSMISYYTVRV